jgi:hypothetical protein
MAGFRGDATLITIAKKWSGTRNIFKEVKNELQGAGDCVKKESD